MADKPKKLSAEEIADIASEVLGGGVAKISAPGGKSRESLRVHFEDKTVIATQRKRLGRMRMEIEVLKRLTSAGAPVPAYLGGTDRVFFQEDVGATRLSGAMKHSNEANQVVLAEATVESLLSIHDAAEKSDLAAIVPTLGDTRDWLRGFVSTPNSLSLAYEFEEPTVDIEGVVDALLVPKARFIKWDARPGNGSVGKDRRVFWFDWEHCGKRQGMEDFAWLAGDEFWPLGADDMVNILSAQLPKGEADENIAYLGHYVTFHIVQRLRLIFRRHTKTGWIDPQKAMKYDRIGTDPDLALRLCEHGAQWADRSDLTRPMVAWYENCATAVWQLDEQPTEATG